MNKVNINDVSCIKNVVPGIKYIKSKIILLSASHLYLENLGIKVAVIFPPSTYFV